MTSYQYDSLGLGPLGEHAWNFGTDDWSTPPAPPRQGVTARSSWGELLYCVVDLAPAIVFFVVTVTLLSVGAGLTVVYVGLPILAAALIVARAAGYLQRVLARVLLGMPSVGPGPIRRRRPGAIGTLAGILTDPAGWRAVAYHCVKIVLAPVAFAFAVAFYAAGLGSLTYPIWRRYLPAQQAADGSLHRGTQFWPDYFVDSWPRMAVLALVGLALTLLAPRVVRFFTTIDRLLISGLLTARPEATGRP